LRRCGEPLSNLAVTAIVVIVGQATPAADRGSIMTLRTTTLGTAAALALTTSVALAQTAAQHNGPGGPKQKVENFVGQYGLTLPPPPPTPPSAPVSTGTVTSPPSAPAKKK